MVSSILYIFLALLGISFLVFIHELGHYFMARRVGIKVEAFAIGFGKALYEWDRNGVKWRINWLPFGGYVKMAGMEKEGLLEPYQIEGGFFATKPWDRIKVAAMGPIVNIIFALLVFTFLWTVGGRAKPFSEFTTYIGWVDKDSGLYQEGIRPGDQITKLNNRPFTGFKDLLYGAVLDDQALTLTGQEIDYLTQQSKPFTYVYSGDRSGDGMERLSSIASSMSSAQFLIYDKMPSGADNQLLPDSPLEGSGIAYGDRIIWVDGALVFSQQQLVNLINAPKVLVTVRRDGELINTRIPRMQVRDLLLDASEKNDIDDWADSANYSVRVEDIQFIPYLIDANGIVQRPAEYVDEKSRVQKLFETGERIPSESPLMPGDQIVAVQGEPVNSSVAIVKELQTKKILIVVDKLKQTKPQSAEQIDANFVSSFDVEELKTIVNSIGTSNVVSEMGSLSLLKPIVPVQMDNFPLNEEQKKAREEKLEAFRKKIEEIKDPKQKAEAEARFEAYKKRLMLGINLQDKMVAYNPQPFALFVDVFKETYRTFFALVTGYLSPKYLSGPVGIIQVIQKSWTHGAKEALFWLGMISLNLGILNLLPIPVLDGGYICLAVWESITKKPIKAKTMEKLILPFVILIIFFFIYLTYHDLSRIVTQLFK